MSLAILVPVLRRPHRAAPVFEAFTAATPEPHRVVFVCTDGDKAEREACEATGADVLVLPGAWQRGDYARKMNYGYRNTSEDVLFLAADDVVPAPHWYTVASKLFSDQIHVVGTNDLGNQRVMDGDHSTHTLITRKYVDEQGTVDGPGAIFCEDYNHWYCDDEFIQTAQMRGAFAPCLDSIVEHFHYFWKKEPMDATYRLGERFRKSDRRVYDRRKHLWQAA